MIIKLAAASLLSATVLLTLFRFARWRYQRKANVIGQELAAAKAALLTTKAEFEARLGERWNSINEARQRETESKTKAEESERQCASIAAELRVALEEKGRFQNEATRVEEAKATLLKRDSEILDLSNRIATLNCQRAEAVKDAQASSNRATDMIAVEREAHHIVTKAKDDQIAKLNEFITQARQVLTTEFKAISTDVLKDASAQLVETTDGLIGRHGEKTTADVRLHQQHIEMMLKPVEETIKRLDQHVADSDFARTKAEALLDNQLNRLAGASESLTNALRKPVVRGSWGEMTLENALENAGLEAEIDFILQHSTDAEDGKKRTDAIINLPKGRKLIIDSKNLMETYLAFASADESQKAVLAEVHSKSLKSHIKRL